MSRTGGPRPPFDSHDPTPNASNLLKPIPTSACEKAALIQLLSLPSLRLLMLLQASYDGEYTATPEEREVSFSVALIAIAVVFGRTMICVLYLCCN